MPDAPTTFDLQVNLLRNRQRAFVRPEQSRPDHPGGSTIEAPSDPLWSAVSECGKRLLNIALFSGAINLLTLSGSIYMLQVYDRVIPARSLATLAALSVILVLAYLLQGYLEAVRGRMLTRLAALFEVKLQHAVYDAMTVLPLTGAPLAGAQQPLRDMQSIKAYLGGMGPAALLDMPWIPIFLIVLFIFHPAIGLAALLGAGVILTITLLAERKSGQAATRTSPWVAQCQTMAQEATHKAELIRALGMAPALRRRWQRINERTVQDGLAAMDTQSQMAAAGKIVRYMLQSAILGIGAALVVCGEATGGIMIASSIITGRALAPIEIALSTLRQFNAAKGAFKRLRATLQATHVEAACGPAPPRSTLAVNALNIAAPGASDIILSNVSFTLEAGMGLAVVGPSGSGKTCLARILAGIWPAADGNVLLDGRSITEWPADDRGGVIGYLPQDVALFDGTIAENIARFDERASPGDVMAAAKLAGVHDMILSLPHGYNTTIGETGSKLSGGQRQRLGLARAVYGNAFLIVLDEPNASLDSEGEAALNNAIGVLRRRGSIVIVISHRPQALRTLDRVLVLVKGQMLACGTYQDVCLRLAAMSAGARRSSATTQPLHASGG
jgi:ATP-binding cassette subfamily C protein PrsD